MSPMISISKPFCPALPKYRNAPVMNSAYHTYITVNNKYQRMKNYSEISPIHQRTGKTRRKCAFCLSWKIS